MATYPKDQFDDIPEDLHRVGAHRAPRRKGLGWFVAGGALLATGVLVLAGLFVLSRMSDSLNFELPNLGGASASPTPEPEATVAPVTDPATIDPTLVSISVLNGTGRTGLADEVGDRLAEQGWPIGSRTAAAQDDVETTTVYYNVPENEGIALGLVQALGVGEAVQSDAFIGAPVTVVIGADYAP